MTDNFLWILDHTAQYDSALAMVYSKYYIKKAKANNKVQVKVLNRNTNMVYTIDMARLSGWYVVSGFALRRKHLMNNRDLKMLVRARNMSVHHGARFVARYIVRHMDEIIAAKVYINPSADSINIMSYDQPYQQECLIL